MSENLAKRSALNHPVLPDDPAPDASPVAAPRRRASHAALVAGLVLVVFGAWVAVRTVSAVRKRSLIADEGRQAASRAVAEGKGVRTVELLALQAVTWRPAVSLDGTLQAASEADLGFKTGGRLATSRARVGDRVRVGTVLATLDQVEATAQVRAAAAAARAAEAQLALAQDSSQRTERLVSTRATSEAVGVQAAGQRSLAVANLEVARAQLELARAALSNHTMVAPFAGTVTRAPAGIGAIVAPGVPLFHLQDTSKLKLAGTIAESDVPLVEVGDPVDVALDDGRHVKGRLSARLPSVDLATRRAPVEATVPNDADPPLLAGSFVHARIESAREVQGVRVPATALRPGSQDEVMLVENGKLVVRHVVFSLAPDVKDGALLVRRGLAGGESIVRAPSPDASDGQAVVVRGQAAASEAMPR